MNTKKFRTRQEFIRKQNPKGKNYVIGLDAGYSSMKVFYEGGYFCFPSFAKRLDKEMLDIPTENDIFFKDHNTGDTYLIGRAAQEMISSGDTNDTDGEMFSRKRYASRMFRILCQTAIGIATADKRDTREIVVQTGLPSSYVNGDAGDLRKALSAPAHFSLRFGTGKWKEYTLKLNPEHIFCDMPQPAGSLYSVVIQSDGKYTQDAKKYLLGNTLVMDVGFGTYDFYGLKNRTVACKESINQIGMHEIMKHTSKKILDSMFEDIRVQALQKCLETGTVICVNEDDMKTEEKSIAPLLEEANEEVFREAFEKAKAVTNAFRDYQYIIIAGGTGEAWYEKIKETFQNMQTIKIIPSNINDHLPFIYSNVRGYYLFRYNKDSRG